MVYILSALVREIGLLPPSSSGLGHLVLSQETGVRFPVGVLLNAKRLEILALA